MLGYYGGYWESWDSNHKIKFDPYNKIININPGVTFLDIKIDIYSAWKEWCLFGDTDNLWQLPAMRNVGGDEITDTTFLGSTFFLINGWRIRPWKNHTNISLEGNIYVDEGGRPIIPDELGNDSVSMTVSSLVQAISTNSSSGISEEEFARLQNKLDILQTAIEFAISGNSIDIEDTKIMLHDAQQQVIYQGANLVFTKPQL